VVVPADQRQPVEIGAATISSPEVEMMNLAVSKANKIDGDAEAQRVSDRLGVERQEREYRELCERQGLDVVAVFEDDDQSAYSGKRRPGYEALCDAVKDREVRAVVAWHPDRLHRSPKELEAFIDLIEATRAKVFTVQAGEYDLTTSAGRLSARVVGAVARNESETKSARLRAKHRQLAEHGDTNGGSDRPFGFEWDRVTIRRSEAKVILELAERTIAGEPLGALTRWLNAKGITTTTGVAWRNGNVRRVLINPRITGLRAVGRDNRVVADAVWKPIVDRPTFERVRAILTDPARRTNGAARTYLLSGLVRCGRCGARMLSQNRTNGSGTKTRSYMCVRREGAGGCNQLRIVADPLEADLVSAVLDHVTRPRFWTELTRVEATDNDAVSVELADIDGRLATLGADFGSGAIPDVAFHAAIKELNRRRTELAALVRATRRTPAVLGPYSRDPGALERDWPILPFERQRAILTAVLKSVTIGPDRRGRGYDPDRIIAIDWQAPGTA
jgi:DNA invertase Pin-like site-specific DNA recombinase